VAAVAGFILAFSTQVAEPGVAEALRNPFPPNPQSLEAGQQLYAGNCQACHGAAGLGDGPASPGLDPPPSDLVVHVPLHPERDLFGFVHDGISGTSMAALGDTLSDEEIWHVINYIGTFE
jgi:mono/diheme cytochrome c family protein